MSHSPLVPHLICRNAAAAVPFYERATRRGAIDATIAPRGVVHQETE